MKLTIVTVNQNNAAGLARTLESTFAAQSGFDDWEQVVVDGASTDGSFAALDKWKNEPEDVARPAYFLFRTPPHQSTFIARRLHERFGGYDETLRICADRKFFFRCILEASPRLLRLPFAISRFEWGGASNNPALDFRKRTEWEEMLVPAFGRFIAHRAAFPPDGRPWIRADVATAANKDRALANVLRRATAGIARLWRFAPTRFLLRAGSSTASFLKRLVPRGNRC